MKVRILRRRGLGNGSTLGIKEFSNHNIEIIRNDKPIPTDTDLLIRWGCTTNFPSTKALNKSQAIQKINQKQESRRILQDANINVPTLFLNEKNAEYPVIIRPSKHSQGKRLWIANNLQEAQSIIFKNIKANEQYYVSKYIKKDKEYGVFIFNNRVWSVIEKQPKIEGANDSIAWNVAQGTHKFVNVGWNSWPMEVCKEALDAVKCFDIDFCRVDVIVKDNIPYVLELNSAHSLTSPYRKETFAKCLDYYIENGSVQNELDLSKNLSYKSIIHPALRVNNLGKNL